jgi:ribonuclease P protein component
VLVVHLLEGDDSLTAPRVGFVVSKAVGNAVVRNRVRRQLRHLVKSHLSTLSPSAELVVRALPAAAELSSAELDAELARCLKRIRSSEAAS